MSNTEVSDAGAASHPLSLDPFAFYEGAASRIGGLGGDKFGHDPTYVFHTPYVDVRRGRASFTVQFEGLRAKRGTLHLYINMFAADGKTFAKLVTSQRVSLNRLMETGGWANVAFEGYRGMRFAIFGHITDETDAVATGLKVFLEEPDQSDDNLLAHEEAHTTTYRAKDVRPTPFICDVAVPSFANPVSQAFTAKQLREAPFKAILHEMGAKSDSVADQWEQAYILQVAHRYGLLAPEAHALGLGNHGDGIAAAMRGRDLEVTLHGLGMTQSHPAEADAGDSSQAASMGMIPPDLVNFDMAWSRGILSRFVRYQDAIAWIERSLRCVRPGGMVVHVDRLIENSSFSVMNELERLALILVARGYEVARLKIEHETVLENGVPMVPFGFIARRAPTPV